MGSIFRSEDMTLCQLYLQPEAAYAIVSELGELGIAQFKDLNSDVSSFQRKFVSDVRKCEEMERQLRFFEKEVVKANLKITDLDNNPEAPSPRDIIDLEATYERMESELKELNNNTDALKRNYLELTELKNVLHHTVAFFDEDNRPQNDGNQLITQDRSQEQAQVYLGFIAGVLPREKIVAFQRFLWFACRGNVLMRYVDMEDTIEDIATGNQVEKVVFTVFFQGDQLQSKIKKICEGFHATLYPCPEDREERTEMASGIQTRMADLQMVLDKSKEQRLRVLNTIAQNLHTWFIKVHKIKAIYYIMNMFRVEQKNYIAECFVPTMDLDKLRVTLNKAMEQTGSSAPSIVHTLHCDSYPTYYRVNKFTKAFQTIIDAYGVATYKEVNPALYTLITFPFLFAVMFGDCGHGLIVALFGLWMVLFERKLEPSTKGAEIWGVFFGGRYMILLMGILSIYSGLLYNDCFSKSLNIFGSNWNVIYDNATMQKASSFMLDPNDTRVYNYKAAAYPFGVDPIWQLAKNKLSFTNSFKKKISVIFGVVHMLFGLLLTIWNNVHFKRASRLITEFLPRLLFMLTVLGYLVSLIFIKWVRSTPDTSHCAPNLLIGLINMFMFKHTPANTTGVDCGVWMWYNGQNIVESFLVGLAGVCVPWMLFAHPLVLYMRNRRYARYHAAVYDPETHLTNSCSVNSDESREIITEPDLYETEDTVKILPETPSHSNHVHDKSSGPISREPFDFGEIMIHQAIHTIEYCLGCVSHAASYLRLWALSLAHAELSDVLWSMVLRIGFRMPTYIGSILIVALFAAWAMLTVGILILMEGLSAFLHTLRLHWVEFQSKFYEGDGIAFEPFSFEEFLDK